MDICNIFINNDCNSGIIVGNNEYLITLFNKFRSYVDNIYSSNVKLDFSMVTYRDNFIGILNEHIPDNVQIKMRELCTIQNDIILYGKNICGSDCDCILLYCKSYNNCTSYDCSIDHTVAVIIDVEIYMLIAIDKENALKLLKDRYNIHCDYISVLTLLFVIQ